MVESRIDTVKYELGDKGIATITMNNPKKRNCMTIEAVKEMTRLFLEADDDPEVRVIILAGEGSTFCSGGDLNMTQNQSADADPRDGFRMFPNLARTIQKIDKPVIARVTGYAYGAGMSLALSCDLIYASEDAIFCSNFNHLGVPPEMGALVYLPMTVGAYKAKEIWYTAKKMTAEEGAQLGFVNQVCKADELDKVIGEVAATISELPCAGIRITKRFTNDVAFGKLDTVLDAEIQNTPLCSTTPESQALFKKFFMEKAKKAAAKAAATKAASEGTSEA